MTSTPEYSFLVRKDVGNDMLNNWHYHPEIELLFIKRSVGTWLVGDHIGHFNTGDVVIIGPNLPHCFRHEYDYVVQRDEAAGETVCVKFVPEMFGSHFLNLPECKEIKQLFAKSCRGLKLIGRTRDSVAKYMEGMLCLPYGKKLVQFLAILEEIGDSKEYITLSSNGFVQEHSDVDRNRIKPVLEYTFTSYNEKITIDKVASILHMTRQSFCRYFKSKTNKTYLQFLMEVRIGHACRLLVEEDINVAETGYACGYNNISHFNHQFKRITGKKPLEYKRDYLNGEGKNNM